MIFKKSRNNNICRLNYITGGIINGKCTYFNLYKYRIINNINILYNL